MPIPLLGTDAGLKWSIYHVASVFEIKNRPMVMNECFASTLNNICYMRRVLDD